MKSNLLKGIIFVAVGASSYGVLATIVKLGNQDGYTTAEITFAQAVIGLLAMIILYLSAGTTRRMSKMYKPTKKDIRSLMLGGIPLGLTSTFYYIALQYVSVSVCIVLLMQSVWIGSILDFIFNKTKPSANKVIAIAMVLIGTLLATNLVSSSVELNWTGVFWGMMASLSYTTTMFASNRVAPGYAPIVRSMFMMMGSVITVTLIWGYSLSQQFDVSVFWKWGIPLAIFGTILPPLLFNKGFPITGLSVGSIVASVELPISVMAAALILGEEVNFIQMSGIALILFAIILMNVSFKKKQKDLT